MRIEENEVIPKLRKAKRTKKGWTALCPAHSDTNPSFSVLKMADGNHWLECFSGCSFVQIVQALGLNEREQKTTRDEPKAQKGIVATYDYTDINGKLLYQMVRTEPKGFFGRRPNGNGNWINKLPDTGRVIYHLPEIRSAREEDFFVIFCEGEKDVDNVRTKLDIPATTIASGANAWKDEYAESFFGLNVVILPDNDKTGKDFAKLVANAIFEQAQSVRVIDLPGLAEKGDVSDWIESGGTRENMIKLIENANEWQPTLDNKESVSTQDLFIIRSANECIDEAKKRPVPKMLFGELWFEGEICFLFADSNAGKSILAVQIADSITKGKQLGSFPFEIESQKVLYFDFELMDMQFTNRYAQIVDRQFCDEYQFSKDFLRVMINPENDLLDESNFEKILFKALEDAILQTEAKILIVDNVTYLKNSNEKAKEALPLMKRLKFLKEKYGLSILALGHTTKRYLNQELTQNDLAGSKMLMNFCDSSFAIGKSCNDEKIRYVKQIKERNTEKIYGKENVAVFQVVKPNNFLFFDFLSFGQEIEHLQVLTDDNKGVLYQQVAELKSQNKSHREVAEQLGISLGSVSNYLQEFEKHKPSQKSDVQGVHSVHPLFDMNTVNEMNKPKEVEKPELYENLKEYLLLDSDEEMPIKE